MKTNPYTSLAQTCSNLMTPPKITFLLGSGISFRSGLPSVDDITNSILYERWYRCTNGDYTPKEENNRTADSTEIEQDFFRGIFYEISPHIHDKQKRRANYEDVFSCLVQMEDNIHGLIINPLTSEKIEELKRRFANLSFCKKENPDSEDPFFPLIRDTIRLIEGVLRFMLTITKKVSGEKWIVINGKLYSELPDDKIEGLALFSALATKGYELDIFTLNHDLLIERYLRYLNEKETKYSDGFDKKENSEQFFLRKWDEKIRIFHLHGALNIHTYRDEEKGRETYTAKMSPPFIFPSIFLTGTINKNREYARGIYSEMFFEFHKRLKKTKKLIVCGYGGGDMGINDRINNWMLEDGNENRIFLFEENNEMSIRDRGFVRNYDNHKETGRLKVIPQYLQHFENDPDSFLREIDCADYTHRFVPTRQRQWHER